MIGLSKMHKLLVYVLKIIVLFFRQETGFINNAIVIFYPEIITRF
jgi:hypothetical protein